MKKAIAIFSSLTAASLFAALAPNADTLTFSTIGPDTYEDGSTVLDNECYALVWSADGNFDGINVDGSPVDASDKVAFIGSFAKGGKCPTVVFTIPNGYVTGGQFDVYLLDTRRYAEDGSVSVGKKADGKIVVNRASKAASASLSSGGVASTAVAEKGVSASEQTALPADVPAPRITDVSVDGDNVIVKVEDTVDFVNYAVQDSATIGGAGTTGDTQIGGGTIYLVSPKNSTGTGFIKVIRK